jgi:WXG100 family type VII secretion target
MTGFAVPLEALADVVERMAGFERAVEQQAADVATRVDRLHATWTGAAADEHALAHRRWTDGVHELRAAIRALRRIASTAHGNYSAAVSANRHMWS